MDDDRTYTTFAGDTRVVSGDKASMLRRTKEYLDLHQDEQVQIFDDDTGKQVDFDFRGSTADVLERAAPPPPRAGPGRPRLGVVSREVSLLPRHWDWLADQPNGASAALRRLVDEARKNDDRRQRAKRAAAGVGRAMTSLAGDKPNFEEAYRALDTGNRTRFLELIGDWPKDIRHYLCRLAEGAWER